MGTHPIFESDFDCLTEMRFTRALRGGSNWSAIPPEKLPPPQLWNKLIPGTPYAEVQKELHKRGLHDPWMRKWYYSYDNVMRRPYTLALALNSTIIKKAMMVMLVCGTRTMLILFLSRPQLVTSISKIIAAG